MANDARFRVRFRRRREQKTDYHKRLALVKSREVRLVIRKSLKGMVAQFVAYGEKGDRTLATANSTELKKFGWNGGTGNVSAAYLTGLLLAKKVKEKPEKVILDLGLQHPAPGGRIFAAAKGVVDGGVTVACSPEAFPKEERLRGSHIAAYAVKEPTKFSRLVGALKPADFEKHFGEIKAKIIGR